MTQRHDEMHFEIDPRVVFQLGSELISDTAQAIVELVKNSYDAGATRAKITVSTAGRPSEVVAGAYYDEPGYVLIEDDGEGMSLETIKEGWLHIARSKKRDLKSSDRVGPRGRTPLGDKGLGRLASQRLGDHVEVLTVARGHGQMHHVWFSWDDFKRNRTLSTVPVRMRSISAPDEPPGTKVLISSLQETEWWERPETPAELEQNLATLISPFTGIEDFELHATVNGTPVRVERVGQRIRDAAHATFMFTYEACSLRLSGKIKLGQLRPGPKRRGDFDADVEADDGKGLLNHLLGDDRKWNLGLERSTSPSWFLEFDYSVGLDNIDKLVRPSAQDSDPGPFTGEIDTFSALELKKSVVSSVFSSTAEYKRYIDQLTGIRVFRDGFGVRVGRDWLGLGEEFTRGSSYYGLRPGNTMGHVAISAAKNPLLYETTSREAFRDTRPYQNFQILLEEVVRQINMNLERLGRSTIAYIDQLKFDRVPGGRDITPAVLSERIAESMKEVGKKKKALGTASKKVQASAAKLEDVADLLEPSLFSSKKLRDKAVAHVRKLQEELSVVQTRLAEASDVLASIEALTDQYDLLHTHVERFEDRLSHAYETMSLGITAEVLAHEVQAIALSLAKRAATLRRELKSGRDCSQRSEAFALHVAGAATGLRKQVAHLDPSLRYVREQRDVIDLASFLAEFAEYHNSRLAKKGIQLEVESSGEESFSVRVNRGKLTQVLDNLILNSDYWLRHRLRQDWAGPGVIQIRTDRPRLLLSDNGPGIATSIEGDLFEAFVTAKKKGRGLGLFLSRQLLEAENCSIVLLRDRNERGAKYIFALDLTGILA